MTTLARLDSMGYYYVDMNKQFIKKRLHVGQKNISRDWRDLKKYVWAYVVLLLGICLMAILVIPALYGTWIILTKNTNRPSATESIGLALLSITLAGVLLLLVKDGTNHAKERLRQDGSAKRAQTADVLGHLLIASALAFALFALLTPFLNAVSTGQSFFPDTRFGILSDWITRWAAFLSFMVGTVALIITLTLGPFMFLSDSLRRNQDKKAKLS